MFGRAKSHVLVSFMESKSSPEYQLMYRRDGEGDKYIDITKVLDQILDRLDDIDDQLDKLFDNQLK